MTTYTFPHSKHLSPSQITEYLSCPLCYKLNRIDRIPKPMNIALPVGGAVHKAVESWRREVLQDYLAAVLIEESARARDDFCDIAAEHFDKSLEADEETGGEVTVDLSGYGSVGEAKDHAVAITRYALPEVAKLDAQRGLIAAELDLQDFPNPWPFPMKGRVDALYGPDADHCSMGADLKTSSKQTAPTFAVSLQMAIYRSFLPVAWLVDQVAKTKLPSFVSYSLRDHGDEFTRELVLEVARRIMNGDFPPRPSYYCKYEHGGPSFSVTVDGYNG